MEILQKALNQLITTTVPELLLAKLITSKLQEQNVTIPKSLAAKVAKHALSGSFRQWFLNISKHDGMKNALCKVSSWRDFAIAWNKDGARP